MDPSPENRGPDEHVFIGQEFQLFNPSRTTSRKSSFIPSLPYNAFDSTITLDFPPLGHIPFRIGADVFEEEVRKSNVFTPLDPEVGHQITQKDFDPTELFKSKDHTQLDLSKVPLVILVGATGEEFLEPGGPYLYGGGFTSRAQALLSRLRLGLNFPTSSYEGPADIETFEEGYILIDDFYPADTGPLGVDEYAEIEVDGKKEKIFMRKGLMIHVPSDIQKLAQITGRFTLAPANPVSA